MANRHKRLYQLNICILEDYIINHVYVTCFNVWFIFLKVLSNNQPNCIQTCWDNYLGIQWGERMRWAWHVARMGKGRGVYRALVSKREGKRPLRRPRSRWEDNIKMDLQEVGYGGMDRIEVAQDRDRWHLWMRWWNFGFHKRGGISWLAANRLAFQEGLCSMK